jgi:hypothetical protein
LPARAPDLWSGRIEFPWRGWGPRETFDPDWTVTLHDSNVTTALSTDHCATTPPIEPGRAGMARRI